MRKILYLISTLITFYLHPTITEASGDRGESVRILWSVSSYKAVPDTEYDKNLAKSYLGKPLDMDSSSISFSGEKCSGISFSRKTTEAEPYLLKTLGITSQSINYKGKEITEITTDCHLQGFQRFIRLRSGELIVPMKGFILFLKPNINYHNRVNR